MKNINKNIVLVVFASIMAVALLGALFLAVYLNASYAKAQFYSSQISNAAVRCQAYQDAFVHTKKIDHVQGFLRSYDDLVHNLELLSGESDVLTKSEIESAENKIREYRDLFVAYKEKYIVIGLTDESGERGALYRDTVFAEETLGSLKEYYLLSMLLSCRRNENKFIIHKDMMFVDKFNENYDILKESVQRSGLDLQIKGEILAQIKQYKSDFSILVEHMKEVGLNNSEGVSGDLKNALLAINNQVLDIQNTVLNRLGKTTRTIYLVLCISSVLILMVLFLGVRLIRFNLRLVSEIHKRKVVEGELAEVNTNLERTVQNRTMKIASQVKDQEKINKEISTLNEFSDYLQRCSSSDEALLIIRDYANRLFPTDVGALYLLSEDKKSLILKTNWGGRQGLFKETFRPDECWGIRMAKFHYVNREEHGLHCDHFIGAVETCYLCVPMRNQEELIGLMLVVCNQGECLADDKMKDCTVKQRQRLVVTIAEHFSLALSNIQLRENLREQSVRDSLTGLHNRRYMLETLDREVSRVVRHNEHLAVVMIDIDFFKRFNDTYGHEAGDEVLKRVAEILLSHVRDEDILCRMGGEEFLVVMSRVSRDVVVKRAESIRQAFESVEMHFGSSLHEKITVSIGISFFPDDDSDINVVINLADKALYEAKKTGRNKTVLFSFPH
ncbi:diguanylate cyclase (GGDEF) domain-containing protein [Maridesulfovibrio ferrireducens]|uniref:diguanylate cyclase n=1 Tax=Maridesulfovibrio ferrireducens TaxID=246191 RepID=A0A1G9FS99_9BACT|nr:sensor domain-containing diguanylate cyclase [Maridesulfovibrio ferrireducens]SDK91289.1 diguanylate cyclase (GGDEF) domain-containing protein [Maridesulfovibrio ferrireducens]